MTTTPTAMNAATPDHEALQALIPWYVNGTLPSEERAQLDAHAARCADCAAEIRAERRLAAAIGQLETDDIAEDESWQSLQHQLRQEAGMPPPDPRWSRRRTQAGRQRTSAGIIGVLIAASLAVMVVSPGEHPAPGPVETAPFQTLTAADEAMPTGAVRVRFLPGLSDALAAEIAAAHGFRLHGLPTTGGTYTLVPASESGDAVVDRVTALDQHPQVLLALPANTP